jgi:hypothetical protein
VLKYTHPDESFYCLAWSALPMSSGYFVVLAAAGNIPPHPQPRNTTTTFDYSVHYFELK